MNDKDYCLWQDERARVRDERFMGSTSPTSNSNPEEDNCPISGDHEEHARSIPASEASAIDL